MEHKIASIISYCTNDFRWLTPCIENVKPFSEQIVVSVADHFLNGEEEDRKLLNDSYANHKGEVDFVEFEFNPSLYDGISMQRLNDPFTPVKYYVDIDPNEIWFWHQINRLQGFNAVNDDMEYVLFVDVDEIFDYKRFLHWLDTFPYRNYNAIRFECYWYFRGTDNRAFQTEDWNGLTLVKKDALTEEAFFKHSSERLNFINFVDGNKAVHQLDENKEPLIHHYSWVKTQKEMLKKVRTWGHHLDRDWEVLVNTEFEREFIPGKDKDFIHGYDFKKVEPYLKMNINEG